MLRENRIYGAVNWISVQFFIVNPVSFHPDNLLKGLKCGKMPTHISADSFNMIPCNLK